MKLYLNTFVGMLFFFTLGSFAQSVEVSGIIKGEDGVEIESASVIALVKATNKLAGYSITNSHGKYSISLEQGKLYSIKISFVGYTTETIEIDLTSSSDDMVKNFHLLQDVGTLDKVVLTYEMPIKVQGDTIMYNADSFTNGTEQKLGDILKKLPGVEVNDDGQIEVEGTVVKKVMVEGKDFFDGDSKLAVENIPSNSVDKIEVLKNFSEVSQLRGVTNNEDNIAINIKLKEGKKNFWFGEVLAGGGVADAAVDRYILQPKLFYYSPEKSVNVIGSTNNTGDIPFNRRDYFEFSGGFKNVSRNSGTSLNLSSDNLGFSSLQNNRANEVKTNFGALNFDYEVNSALDVSGFFIYSNTGVDMQQNSTRTYNDGLTEVTETKTDQNNHIGLGKLSAMYKPHDNFQLDYDMLLKASKQDEGGAISSSFAEINNNINTLKNDEPYAIQQNANIHYTLHKNHIFSSELQYLISQEQPFYNATFLELGADDGGDTLENSLPFSEIFPYNTNQKDYGINQDKMIKTNKFDGKLDYYYVLHKNHNFNISAGSVVSNQNFNSSIFQNLDNGTSFYFEDDTFNNNDVDYTFTDLFLGLKYNWILGNFTFTPGVTLHNYNVASEQLGTKVESNETILLPRFYAKYEIGKSESIRFTYSKTAAYVDVNSFAQGYVFNNYNALFSGNSALQNGLYENLRLQYRSFSLYSKTQMFASLSYSKKKQAIKNILLPNQINRISLPVNSDQVDETFSANARWEKTIGKVKVNTRANFGLSQLYNFQTKDENNLEQLTAVKSKSITQSYTASMLTNFKKWPNFEVGYQYSVNNYDNVNAETTFFTHKPFANVEWLLFDAFRLKSNYDWYNYFDEDNTIENKYSFLDASISYQKKDTKWEYILEASNLLNTTSINRDSFNQALNITTTSEYFVQPRYLILKVKYIL